MKNTAPHYLLMTEAKTVAEPREDGRTPSRRSGRWRFVLEQMGYESRVEVADREPFVVGERLELLVVVRGLESLEQPSRVTLLTTSRYVGRGIRHGITQWRDSDWRWERFGKMVEVKHSDLWRRVDHAMGIHQLDCRIWDFGALQRDEASDQDDSTSVRDRASSRNRFSQRISLAERHDFTRHASVDVVVVDPTAATSAAANRVDRGHQRSNIIRPHGDVVGTARRSFGPAAFASDEDLASAQAAAADFSRAVTAAIASPPPAVVAPLPGPRGNLAGPETDFIAAREALVKPPRAGRAYGQAVN